MNQSALTSTLSIDGTGLGHGLPSGPVPLKDIRPLMLDRATDPHVGIMVWQELARAAQAKGEPWLLAATWMMIPGLCGISARISRAPGTEQGEIEAEIIAGFMAALRVADTGRENLSAHLWWAAYRAGQRARRMFDQAREIPVDDLDLAAQVQTEPGDPDALLDDAVHAGVISASEADLITRTRLEGERLGAAAERLGLRYNACAQRRWRAEGRLAGYVLIGGDALPPQAHQARQPGQRRRPAATASPRPNGKRAAA